MTNRKIVRARVPLRLGLAGGGTDLSPYCDEYGGAVLNATISRYAYAFVEGSPDNQIHFSAKDLLVTEQFEPDLVSIAAARLKLHAGVVRRMALEYAGGEVAPIKITSFVDAPPGSGLGSSSALVVALVEACANYYSAPLGPYDIAHLAYDIERRQLSLAGGRQDQYAATFGGINFIEFLPGDRVIVNPLRVPAPVARELEASLVICSSGISRDLEKIIVEQQRNMTVPTGQALESLHQLKADAAEMKDALLRGQIKRMADVLNRSWASKKRTAAGVSTDHIDHVYEVAMNNGAIGGKISGAGGGGFLMFVVPPESRLAIVRALNQIGLRAEGVQLSTQGAECWTV